MNHVDDLTLTAAPVAATALIYINGAPWWLCLLLGLSSPAVHVYRTFMLYRLATCALSKAETRSVPAIMATVIGLADHTAPGKQK